MDRSNTPTPLIIKGGPGGTSLFGLFVENGPYTVRVDNTLAAKQYTWNRNYGMIFIDNPTGAGFSYGQLHSSQEGIAADLMELLSQFYVRGAGHACCRLLTPAPTDHLSRDGAKRLVREYRAGLTAAASHRLPPCAGT